MTNRREPKKTADSKRRSFLFSDDTMDTLCTFYHMFMQKYWKEIVGGLIIVILFVVASVLSNRYADELASLLEGRYGVSLVVYALIVIIAFVFAPLNSIPLLPVAVEAFGSVVTFSVSLAAWTAGTTITYFLARRFGRPFVERYVDEKHIARYEKVIPRKNQFLAVLVLHAFMPGDILGYVMGLFMELSYFRYALASLLGNIPFGIVIIFAAGAPFEQQIAIGAVLLIVMVASFWWVGRRVG